MDCISGEGKDDGEKCDQLSPISSHTSDHSKFSSGHKYFLTALILIMSLIQPVGVEAEAIFWYLQTHNHAVN